MDARRQGIEMVYQDYALAHNPDVAANVFMGREAVRIKSGLIGVMNYEYTEQETRSLPNRLKIDISYQYIVRATLLAAAVIFDVATRNREK
jgi:simple sugar transport system ATP-binding protein